MARKCASCGAEIPESDEFCPECGWKFEELADEAVESELPVEEEVPEAAPETVYDAAPAEEVSLEETLEKMMEENAVEAEGEKTEKKSSRKLKWWYIAIPVAVVIVLTLILVLGPLRIYIAPKLVLAEALTNTGSALQARSEGTPLVMMGKNYDDSGRVAADASMQFSTALTGEIRYDMRMNTDAKTRQSLMNMSIRAAGQDLDMNVYVDPDMLALNMDMLTGDDYYAVLYDTFGEDIRDNDFLYGMLGEEGVQSVEALLDMLNRSLDVEPLSEEEQKKIYETYLQILLDAILEKEASVEKKTCTLDGEEVTCHSIGFVIEEKEFGVILEKMLDTMENDPSLERVYRSNFPEISQESWEDFLKEGREVAKEIQEEGEGSCVLDFYLYDGYVSRIYLDYDGLGDENTGGLVIDLSLSKNPAVSDITMDITATDTDEESNLSVTLTTEKQDDSVREVLEFAVTEDNTSERFSVGYVWTAEDGDITVTVNQYSGDEEQLSFEITGILQELEDGFSFSIPDFADCFTMIAGEDTYGDMDIDCSMEFTIRNGEEIEVPEVKNLAKMTKMQFYRMIMNLY